MNSLNLLSARVGIGARPRAQRSQSVDTGVVRSTAEDLPPLKRSVSHHTPAKPDPEEELDQYTPTDKPEDEKESKDDEEDTFDEKQPLLDKDETTSATHGDSTITKPPSILYRIVTGLTGCLRWVLSRLLAPGVYLVACFRQEDGTYSPLAPFRRSRRRKSAKNGRGSAVKAIGLSGSSYSQEKRIRRSDNITSGTNTHVTYQDMSDSGDALPDRTDHDSRAQSSSDDSMPTRRSIRIKVSSDEASRKRKQRRSQKIAGTGDKSTKEELAAAELKSPTSPASALGMTKYPHAPKPPRPLIPRRLPSLTSYSPSQSSSLSQKTLVLDLDETLIHSLAKGGRMSSGHMVEVRLASPSNYGGMTLGPQHPILYYVHKRPHCDDFLRKISQWYKLVIFTASVQEYADPVIDWLEQERKFFAARYYRQHCTFRNGAYIKDLSSIEPDLSKVMILDNSPLSYIFHEANAIPIEGWINDPTDNDLLHLIPLFEGLQYVTDVRALLALRKGEFEAVH